MQESSNLSVSDVAASIVARQEQPVEDTNQQSEDSAEEESEGLFDQSGQEDEETPESAEESGETADESTEEEESEPETLMAKLGISEWNRNQLGDLAREIGSRVGEENGTLRQEVRELRTALESELAKRRSFEGSPVKDNPYAKVNDISELEETLRQAEEAIRTGQNALDDNEDAASDETILTIGSEQLTRRDVRAMIRRAEDAKNRFIPDRFRQLQADETRERAYKANRTYVEKAHPWLVEEGNDLRSDYEQIAPGIVQQVRESLPDLYPKIDLVLADHAYMSQLRARGETPGPSAKKPAIKPAAPKAPSSPGGKAAPSGRANTGKAKAVEAAQGKFHKTGSVDDLAAFLEARATN